MLVEIRDSDIRFGDRFTLSFQRTLRVPDDGKTYPLPPGLGRFPVVPVEGTEPAVATVAIPMHQGEALWLAFLGASWKPNAVKVAAGGVNVLTGERDAEGLSASPQNYVVSPPQPWLDGINTGEARVRQFVAAPLGQGDTIAEQLSGDASGGIQVTVYDPKPGIFPDEEPPRPVPAVASRSPMGLGTGGAIVQRIYPDRYGIETWDQHAPGRLAVRILNVLEFEALTGHKAPSTPVTAQTYTEHGLPWFALYDEDLGDIAPTQRLKSVRSLRERRHLPETEDPGFDVPDEQTIHLRHQETGPPKGPVSPPGPT